MFSGLDLIKHRVYLSCMRIVDMETLLHYLMCSWPHSFLVSAAAPVISYLAIVSKLLLLLP